MKGTMNRSVEPLDFKPVEPVPLKELKDHTVTAKITKTDWEGLRDLAKFRDTTVSEIVAEFVSREVKKNSEEIEKYRAAIRAARR